MSFRTRRLLASVALKSGDTLDLNEALDFSDCSELQIAITVESPGTGLAPLILVQHSPSNDTGSYLDFGTPVKADLTVKATSWFSIHDFTRWVTWTTTGTIENAPVVTLDVIGRG